MDKSPYHQTYKAGDLFEDCAVHPCICTIGNEDGGDMISGISLVNGREVFCSVTCCGLRPITIDEVMPLRERIEQQ